MVAKEYANFEPRTKIPEDEFITQLTERGIKLESRHCLAVENTLKEYERFCYLTKLGEGKQLPPKLRKLEERHQMPENEHRGRPRGGGVHLGIFARQKQR